MPPRELMFSNASSAQAFADGPNRPVGPLMGSMKATFRADCARTRLGPARDAMAALDMKVRRCMRKLLLKVGGCVDERSAHPGRGNSGEQFFDFQAQREEQPVAARDAIQTQPNGQ